MGIDQLFFKIFENRLTRLDNFDRMIFAFLIWTTMCVHIKSVNLSLFPNALRVADGDICRAVSKTVPSKYRR